MGPTADNKTISLVMPTDLLIQIDVLAKRDFMSRSDVLRQAVLAYVRQADLDTDELERLAPEYPERRPKPKPEPKREYDYQALAKKYPHVHGDRKLLEFLDDYEQGRL